MLFFRWYTFVIRSTLAAGKVFYLCVEEGLRLTSQWYTTSLLLRKNLSRDCVSLSYIGSTERGLYPIVDCV